MCCSQSQSDFCTSIDSGPMPCHVQRVSRSTSDQQHPQRAHRGDASTYQSSSPDVPRVCRLCALSKRERNGGGERTEARVNLAQREMEEGDSCSDQSGRSALRDMVPSIPGLRRMLNSLQQRVSINFVTRRSRFDALNGHLTHGIQFLASLVHSKLCCFMTEQI